MDNPIHVMVDVETLGTRPGSIILAIGAVKFMPTSPGLVIPNSTFYRNVSITSSLTAGLTVDGHTIEWWLSQPQFARDALQTPKPVRLDLALSDFNQWYGLPKLTWSHGAAFDVVLLEAAFRASNIPHPWTYRDVRDTRTLFWLSPTLLSPILDDSTDTTALDKHTALADAARQVEWVIQAYQRLRSKGCGD